MKKTEISLCLLGILAWMTACKPSEANAPQGAENTPVRDTVLTECIRFCESTYPYRDGLLVANFGTEALDPLNTQGKGYILYFEADKVDTLLPPQGYLSAPKGMFIRGERFVVCDVNKVVEFRLDSLSLAPREIVLPAEDLFVNDLAAWGDTLYISVTNTGRIYRMDLSDPQASPVLWAQVPGANGMTFGQDGTLYVASYPADGTTTPDNVVYRIADLSAPAPEKLFEQAGQYDGIALSADGKMLYVTSWVPSGVFAYDLTAGGELLPLDLGEFQGAADMTLRDSVLYIPDLPSSRVVVRRL